MSALLLPLVILATLVVLVSGVWVKVALIDAVWHVERPDSASSPRVSERTDENTRL